MGTWRGTHTHVGMLGAVASARRMAMGDEAKRRQQAQALVVAWLLCVVLDGGWVPGFSHAGTNARTNITDEWVN